MVTVEEMKNYLRIDFDEDDGLLLQLITQAESICMDVARLEKEAFEKEPIAKIAVFYTVAYFYEHREDANHHELMLDLRNILFGIRQEGF